MMRDSKLVLIIGGLGAILYNYVPDFILIYFMENKTKCALSCLCKRAFCSRCRLGMMQTSDLYALLLTTALLRRSFGLGECSTIESEPHFVVLV